MYFAGAVIAKCEYSGGVHGFTIRHVNCEVIVAQGKDTCTSRCSSCTQYRKTLCALARRSNPIDLKASERSDPSSHTNYRFLTTPEKINRLGSVDHQHRITQKKLFHLQEKLQKIIYLQAVAIDEDDDTDMCTIMAEEEAQFLNSYPEGSFQHLFWEEQKKAAAKRKGNGVRWHPLMIKFCLYLIHQSGKAYETLRESNCIRLPSQQTLWNYSHAVKAKPGFSPEVDHQLMEAANVMKSKEWEKLVIILLDEMYIKEDLVYEKQSGTL